MSRLEQAVLLLSGKTCVPVGDITNMVHLARELTPIFATLRTLGPGNDHHPAVRQLFNWLADPQRTGDEFTYVISEVADDAFYVMEDHFPDYVYMEGHCMYTYLIVAQALAAKCPVLEGSWEEAAWTLVMNTENRNYSNLSCDPRLSAWTIHVIGDPDICPNPYLKYELIKLLTRMVDISAYYASKAIESVLSACSYINLDYIMANFNGTSIMEITQIFDAIAEGVNLFDEKLAAKWFQVKTSRCSAIVYDVGCDYAMNPSRYTEPMELYGLINLFKINADFVRQVINEIQLESIDLSSILRRLKYASGILYALVTHFQHHIRLLS